LHHHINSASLCQIVPKFGVRVHSGSAEAAEWLKSTSGQIQDGRLRPNWKLGISAFSWTFCGSLARFHGNN